MVGRISGRAWLQDGRSGVAGVGLFGGILRLALLARLGAVLRQTARGRAEMFHAVHLLGEMIVRLETVHGARHSPWMHGTVGAAPREREEAIMHVVSALYDEREAAAAAVHQLRDHGFGDREVTVVATPDPNDAEVGQNDEAVSKRDARIGGWGGSALGAAVGGYLGVLSMALIPALPLLVAGGALVGGIAGGVGGLGVAEKDAHEAESTLRAGGVLVIVRERDDERAHEAIRVLEDSGARTVGMGQEEPVTPEA
jgi:uncharacterized membrane protein